MNRSELFWSAPIVRSERAISPVRIQREFIVRVGCLSGFLWQMLLLA